MTTSVTILPSGTYEGTVSLGPLDLPIGVTTVSVSIDRTNWTGPSTTMSVANEWSPDGGETWRPFGAVLIPGGVLKDQQGAILAQSKVTFQVPQPDLAGRQLRATATVVGSIQISISASLD